MLTHMDGENGNLEELLVVYQSIGSPQGETHTE